MSSISRPLVKNLNMISASSRRCLSLKVLLGATGAKTLRDSCSFPVVFLFFLLKIAAGFILGLAAGLALFSLSMLLAAF